MPEGVTMVKVLKITLAENGAINVEGPIAEKGLCYMMLEVARDAIKEFNDKREKAGAGLVAARDLLVNGH